jgi:hypothetical protein
MGMAVVGQAGKQDDLRRGRKEEEGPLWLLFQNLRPL